MKKQFFKLLKKKKFRWSLSIKKLSIKSFQTSKKTMISLARPVSMALMLDWVLADLLASGWEGWTMATKMVTVVGSEVVSMEMRRL